MIDIRNMIIETVEKIVKSHCTKELILESEKGTWANDLWNHIKEAGVISIGIDEEKGGSGGSKADGLSLLKLVGEYAAPLPIAETIMANWLLDLAELPLEEFPTVIALNNKEIQFEQTSNGWLVTGTVRDVPFGRHAKKIIIVQEREDRVHIAKMVTEKFEIETANNLADEPWDTFILENIFIPFEEMKELPMDFTVNSIKMVGALTKVAMVSGALNKILEMTVAYSLERKQFGRPIAKFQALQQQLAIFSGEVAASRVAVEYAIEAENKEEMWKAVMMAKIRLGKAINISVPIAHQVHGAMGITVEYPLHLYTKRLWSWREGFGDENEWAEKLGRYVIKRDISDLWSTTLK